MRKYIHSITYILQIPRLQSNRTSSQACSRRSTLSHTTNISQSNISITSTIHTIAPSSTNSTLKMSSSNNSSSNLNMSSSNSNNQNTLNIPTNTTPKQDYSPSVYSTYSYEKPIVTSSSSSASKSQGIKKALKKFVTSLGESPTAEYDRKQAEARGEKYVEGSSTVDFGPWGKMPGSGSRL